MTRTARQLDEVEQAPSAVTIGVFDGVHRGHQAIVQQAVGTASSADLRSVAVTFDPHPTAVVRPEAVPPLLQPLDVRVAALAETGVDLVLVLPFTEELSQLSPEDFVARVLGGTLQTHHVVVGSNFRFGHRAAGDVERLVALGSVHGYTARGVELLDLDGEPISSTAVRDHLSDGDVAWATAALGRPWTHRGTVVRGDGRGRTIGIPTANVVAPEGILRPGGGVYAARARLHDGTAHDAVVNVGTRPTFDGRTTTVEAHLLDVDGALDLYDQQLALAFLERLRDERRFDGPAELVAQIHRDVEAAREHFAR